MQAQPKGFSYAFKQQIMKAWQPVPTLNSTIILFATMSLFFLIMGIVLISYSNDIATQEFQYDSYCSAQNSDCVIQIALDSNYKSPVFFYYQLTNFYQNHRRYVKSKSPSQLSGTDLSESELDECDPVVTNDEMGKTSSVTNEPLKKEEKAIPCGLIAKSYFNDTFNLFQVINNTKTEIKISSNGIAWPSDLDGRYKNIDLNRQWIDMEDERFMVWMRTAALPQFRKLWGKIDQDLEAGIYEVQIKNTYNVSSFNGKKYIVFSTTNAFGGKNEFLSIAYICVGVVCCVVTLGFLIRKFLSKADQKKNR
ncbi:unnamed protein product [Paramecium pentaurelia]|uniref:Ligand-effect modulator 3 LEM3 family protein n=1 Tax=Paramecium pentaurelia TaxID=43138 RepID=A0A8S1TA76_9CILI|nr:unnamed protein product [Paramecium pentaurelia]